MFKLQSALSTLEIEARTDLRWMKRIGATVIAYLTILWLSGALSIPMPGGAG